MPVERAVGWNFLRFVRHAPGKQVTITAPDKNLGQLCAHSECVGHARDFRLLPECFLVVFASEQQIADNGFSGNQVQIGNAETAEILETPFFQKRLEAFQVFRMLPQIYAQNFRLFHAEMKLFVFSCKLQKVFELFFTYLFIFSIRVAPDQIGMVKRGEKDSFSSIFMYLFVCRRFRRSFPDVESACASALHESVVRQFAQCVLNYGKADIEMGGHIPYRGKTCAGFQDAAPDIFCNLIDYLLPFCR